MGKVRGVYRTRDTVHRERRLMTVRMDWHVRSPLVDDGPRIWQLIRDAGTLDLNSPYTYLMLSKFFNKTCLVADAGDCLAGFISGFHLPEQPDTLFVWQVAVHPDFRRQRLGTRLLEALLDSEACRGTTWLEATVTPDNGPSDALFRGIAKARNATCTVLPCFPASCFPGESHQPEHLYHIGPLHEGSI
ncbi:diaminobutyrate acetyltransferase [Alicyclobacillus cycloheptanicus]|uniref:L-2,4-diaminobutyric acid acetyltransferase n=1 Tax=Alicyclobacillus cycloheptanicus TaxID=1457 RepID=A0ABT9XHT0_9BACL|nr:diaminobutyrate acetyltransferase [Alicyclobacillus cycloheptanicus]MDQ0189752.1 L-2,4-diaminobutyric acid acetyltransferase [Alicyclobacillus cycloheptanicus]